MENYMDLKISHLPTDDFIKIYELIKPYNYQPDSYGYYRMYYHDPVLDKECYINDEELIVESESNDPEQLSLDYEKSLHLNAAGVIYLPYICQTK